VTTDQKHPRALVEVTVAAPADEVWRALRDPARLAQWFGWDAETLAAEIQHIFFTHAIASDAERVLRFDDDHPDWFEVEDRGATSVLRIIRPAPTAEHDWSDVFEDMTQGWIAFVQQLRFALERHAGEHRRTIYLSGTPHAGGALGIVALGIPTLPPGARYAFAAPTGDALAGTVWHRNRHQVGLTVDGFGDGLAVVMDRVPDDKSPTGACSITLTTYGLADDAFAALEARWRAWWADHFTVVAPTCA
jgi:uncharacterized protein YndB with AHSA1/START domain